MFKPPEISGKRVLVLGDSHCIALRRPLKEELLKIGASLVKFNYKSGRSAYSFFNGEHNGEQKLRFHIQYYKIDTVIVILGTNDTGYYPRTVTKYYTKLRNLLKKERVEVCVFGPPSLPRKLKKKNATVVEILKKVFSEEKVFDLRSITSNTAFGREPDGIHFTRAGAAYIASHIAYELNPKPIGRIKLTNFKLTKWSLLGFGLLFIIDRRNKLNASSEDI